MKKNPLFKSVAPKSAKGYSAFPLDNLANFTSVCGYLLPVYWKWLDPGDKVTMSTLLRTRTQPFTSPAMGTIIERLEWFAVPIQQLYKPFSTKFYGINDVESDLLPTSGYNNTLPYVQGSELEHYISQRPSAFNSQSMIPVAQPTQQEVKRLFDCFGLPKGLGVDSVVQDDTLPWSVNILPFAAYQKIYYDHFRLTDREVNDPQAYNFDSLASNPELTYSDRYHKLFMLRKRPYLKDYFTSMQVSPLFGSQDVNAAGNDLGALNSWLNGLSKVTTAVPSNAASTMPNSGYVSPSNTEPTSVRLGGESASTTALVVGGVINPSNIRSLFAVEKLLEVTRRAKKHYDMQTLAHFGVDVPKGLAGECYKLGTHEQYIQIGEVISTAETADGSLGERAGIGSSNGRSEKFHFEADCHCILMCIYSAEPVVNYTQKGIDRNFTMTNVFDFYKSEFDNLGMQPIFFKELCQFPAQGSGVDQQNSVIGWQYRYAQLKSAYNRSFCGCASDAFKEWCFNRTDIDKSVGFSRNFFYVWPTDLNDVLMASYTGTGAPSTAYARDYFVNQIYFDVVKSSKKSIYGQPNL